MKSACTTFGILLAGAAAALCVGLSAGCASPSSSQKVYDRYAELVASRNQPASSGTKASSATSRSSASSAAPAKASSASSAKTPAASSAKTPASAPVAAAPAAAKPAAPSVAKPASVPAPVPVKNEPAPVRSPVAAAPAKLEPAPTQVVAPAPPAAPAAPAPVQVIAPVKPAAPAEPVPPVVPAAPAVPAAPVAAAEPAAVPPPVSAPAAVSTSMVAALPDNAYSAEGGYMLKVGDGLQIYLRGIPMPEVIEDIIDETGKITLPLINEVQAAGLSASDLERNIRQTYLGQDIYRNITVNVVVPTRYYFILGEVRASGRFQIMSATRVSQAIAAAGGYTEYASGKVQVKRRGQIVKVIKNARRLERSPEDDILLEPDDVVEVLRSWI